MSPMQGTDLQRTYNGFTTVLQRTYSVVPVTAITYHTTPITQLTSDHVRCTSHEVKSACQPKGWRTSFGLTSAKLQQISLEQKEMREKNI